MAFAIPTLTDIIERIEADLETELPGTDASLRRAVVRVLARTEGGAVFDLYQFLEFISQQIIPDTAEAEFLERWSTVWGVDRRAADYAAGNITFVGTNGAVIPAGTTLQRGDGAEFTTDAEATIAAGTATVAVTASVAGEDGNTDAGGTLTLVSPIAGVTSAATVAAGGLADGADAETDAALLARLLLRIQQPPHGGADFDYTAWALEVADVTRVWVYPLELGLGTVTVRFMMDDKYGDGIPLADDVTAVQEHIDAVRPVTADVTVVAPTAVPLNFTFTSLSPDTAAVRAAIEAELDDLIRREAEPAGTIPISHFREAVSIAAGENDYVMTAPNADVTVATGEITTIGTITWPA